MKTATERRRRIGHFLLGTLFGRWVKADPVAVFAAFDCKRKGSFRLARLAYQYGTEMRAGRGRRLAPPARLA